MPLALSLPENKLHRMTYRSSRLRGKLDSLFQPDQTRLRPTSVVILDDMAWSECVTDAWKQIAADPDVRTAIDLFSMGLCVLAGPKQSFFASLWHSLRSLPQNAELASLREEMERAASILRTNHRVGASADSSAQAKKPATAASAHGSQAE